MVITAQSWRSEGLLIDLSGLVTVAAECASLELVDRSVALPAAANGGRLFPRHSFFQLLQTRWARDRGDDRLLIAHEDVVILRHVLEPAPTGEGSSVNVSPGG